MTAPAETAVLLVLAGPAGAGKTTLCDRFVAETPVFSRVVTATTRSPRRGEVNDMHYHFLTPAQFDQKIAAGEFLEWAHVHGAHRYGTLAASVLGPLSAGRSLIINLDVQGVDHFRRAAETSALLRRHMATVFISVPTSELQSRLLGRGKDSTSEIARRMVTAAIELREADKFEYRIISRSRDEDFAALIKIWHQAQAKLGAGPFR
ncbi:MAG TPA: guanylate kinase [Opitutaceae bacterium]|jgi:guanylate kinase|nr:guanylate kinase [Opitutaceae bacterium]